MAARLRGLGPGCGLQASTERSVRTLWSLSLFLANAPPRLPDAERGEVLGGVSASRTALGRGSVASPPLLLDASCHRGLVLGPGVV